MKRYNFLLCLLFLSCSSQWQEAPSAYLPYEEPPVAPKKPKITDFTISEVKTTPSASTQIASPIAPTPPIATTPLAASEVSAIFAKLPALPVSDAVPFSLREASLPPPKTAVVFVGGFPPNETPPNLHQVGGIQMKSLDVLRVTPSGEVSADTEITIVFSRAMVGLTTLSALSEAEVPAKISPTLKGKWHWISPKILRFTPSGPLPMSTKFTVTIPAGTKAAHGETLAEEKEVLFTTVTTEITGAYPKGDWRPSTELVFFSFNQTIKPEKILSVTKARAGAREVALRLATPEEIAKNKNVQRLYASAPAGTAVVFSPVKEWPANKEIKLKVGPNIPSEEGPLTKPGGQFLNFSSHGPFAFERAGAYSGFEFSFSNPIDEASLDKSKIKIEPSIKNPTVSVSTNLIYIYGDIKPNRYLVTIPAGLRDIFGQEIDREIQMELRVGIHAEGKNAYISSSRNNVLNRLTPEQSKQYPITIHDLEKVQLNVYRVKPKDWDSKAVDSFRYNQKKPFGEKIYTEEIKPTKEQQGKEMFLDLSPALKSSDGVGQILVEVVEPGKGTNRARYVSWVQVTRLSLDAYYDSEHLYAWVSALEDARSIEGAEVMLAPKEQKVSTDASGIARLSAPGSRDSYLLSASYKEDSVFLPNLNEIAAPNDRFYWYVTDGRGLYRPGEEVKLKGWLRYHKRGDATPFQSVKGVASKISYTASDELGNEFTKGEVTLDENGGFTLSLILPSTANLGQSRVDLSVMGSFYNTDGVVHNQYIEVQEYRRPEFEVSSELPSGPFFLGDTFVATTSASYFSGGGLPAAGVNYDITSSNAYFSPPGLGEYSFGSSDYGRTLYDQALIAWSFKTDEDGQHLLQISTNKGPEKVFPMLLSGSVSVTDVNRQSFSSNFATVVHPAAAYVGVKLERPYLKVGEPIPVHLLASDLDGKLLEGRPLNVELGRWEWSEKEKKEILLGVESCQKKSGKEKVVCEFIPNVSGRYQIEASIKDDAGRESKTRVSRYVVSDSGASTLRPEKIELLSNQSSYKPGDTAELVLIAPFYPAEGMLVVSYKNERSVERFIVDSPTKLLQFKIEKDSYPSIIAQVELIGFTTKDDAKSPAYATQSLTLRVPPTDKKLLVEVSPKSKELVPGAETSVEIALKDQSGKPVEGEVAVFVMDESLLAMSGFKMPNPVDMFYQWPSRGMTFSRFRETLTETRKSMNSMTQGGSFSAELVSGVPTGRSYQDVVAMLPGVAVSGKASRNNRYRVDGLDTKDTDGKKGRLGKALDNFRMKRRPDSDADGILDESDTYPGIELRSSFESMAFFEARAKVDATGKVTIPFTLQGSLTRYRIMVVAASGVERFGTGESNVSAKLPLMVRPSAPRFLLLGDQAEVPVVLQNQTDKSMKVNVALRASLSSLDVGKGYKIEIPANDRREIRFPLTANSTGKMTIQVAASDGKLSDAAESKLPIYTPATTEAFALYGEIDEGAISQPVKVGDDVITDFGGLTISTSSTALSSLTDAFFYLVRYPYECSEQRASRILAILALKDFLQAFKSPELPSKEQIDAYINADLYALEQLQTYNGGFGFFSNQESASPYNSIHVTHALQRAKLAGYTVKELVLKKAKNYLDHRGLLSVFTTRYSQQEKDSIHAYAVYVLRLFGDKASLAERKLTGKFDALPLESLGWILPSLGAEERLAVQKILLSKVEETAGAAHFETEYTNGSYYLLGAPRRTDAILLEALIETDPKNELIPKLVKGLMSSRVKGRWSSTQENVFILLALQKYFETYEKATPDFVAKLWLGESYAGEYSFKGREAKESQVTIPMRDVVAKGDTSIFVSKEGAGRLYYRLGLSYAPKEKVLPAVEQGFVITRRYEALDHKDDVLRQKDGSWMVKAGARVKVVVTMMAPSTRYHVALVDSMPAGFEAENPDLPTSIGDVEPGRWEEYGYTWYQHQNLRDERVEAFTTYLPDGVYSYSYTAKATTPGVFLAPPAKAEEMYSPETFGRSASEWVTVVE